MNLFKRKPNNKEFLRYKYLVNQYYALSNYLNAIKESPFGDDLNVIK